MFGAICYLYDACYWCYCLLLLLRFNDDDVKWWWMMHRHFWKFICYVIVLLLLFSFTIAATILVSRSYAFIIISHLDELEPSHIKVFGVDLFCRKLMFVWSEVLVRWRWYVDGIYDGWAIFCYLCIMMVGRYFAIYVKKIKNTKRKNDRVYLTLWVNRRLNDL